MVAVQPCDTGLVSRCPVSTTRGPAPKDSSPSAFGRPGSTGCRLAASKPDSAITDCRNPASSPSSPSTLGMRHTSWTSSISRCVSTAAETRALSCSGVGTYIPTRCVKIRSQILYLAKFRLGPAPLASSSRPSGPLTTCPPGPALRPGPPGPQAGTARRPPGGVRAGDGAGWPEEGQRYKISCAHRRVEPAAKCDFYREQHRIHLTRARGGARSPAEALDALRAVCFSADLRSHRV